MKKNILFVIALIAAIGCFQKTQAQNTSPYWSLSGNNNAANSYNLGTTIKKPLKIITGDKTRIFIDSTGNVSIGNGNSANTSYKFYVKGQGTGMYSSGTEYGIKTEGGNYGLYSYGSRYSIWASGGIGGIYANGDSYGVYAYSQNGQGVYGSSDSYGVYGVATKNTGVYGKGGLFGTYGEGGSYGSYGYSETGNGVYGISYSGTGVYGNSYSGVAVYGVSNYYYAGYFSSTNYPGGYFGSVNSYGGSFHSNNSYGIFVGNDNSDIYCGVFLGSVLANLGFVTSDRRLKKNIEDFSNAMSIINKLQPKHYEFKSDTQYTMLHLPTGRHYGLLAQDLEQILPNLVHQETLHIPAKTESTVTKAKPLNEKEINKHDAVAVKAEAKSIDVKAVNYIELIPIIIKGMQELSKQNDSLINRSTAQQKINADLQNQIDELRAMIASNSTGSQSTSLTSTSLQQNVPNPFNHTTTINYTLPQSYSSAKIIVTDKNGKTLKEVSILAKGKGSLQLNASTLAGGAYQYSLYVNGMRIDTKQMILTK